MKKTFLIILLSLIVITLPAQEDKDKDKKEPKTKDGWNMGVLPTITYDTDLGFQYGALVNLFNYGNGDIYPKYYQSLYFEVSRYTKGSGIYRFMFDSEHLIPGIRWTSDLSYLTDQAYDFYGFNGYESVYNKSWVDQDVDGGTDYKSRMYYRLARNLFRFKNDFHGKLSGDKLLWNAGLTFQSFDISSVDIDKLNKNKDPEDMLPSLTVMPGIYELYTQEWGIISPEDADGGWINALKLGVVYDSRDNRANPWKGIWTEAGIETSQKFLGSEATFGKLYFTHRQFITLVQKKLTFAYRLGYQQTIFGDVPFYYQSQVIVSLLRGATSEGLGGSKSLRGIKRNRVIGDGFAYGNAELRWRAARFSFINQNWYLGINLFSDFGLVTDKIKFTVPTDLGDDPDGNPYVAGNYFNEGAEALHFSAGLGLRLVMNENFIISADFGKAFNEQDGGIGFYMGLNYMF
jgi:outer membrane protein assembly factor BamA